MENDTVINTNTNSTTTSNASTSSSTSSNSYYEIENQFILRMPLAKDGEPHKATKELKEALVNGTNNLKERLFIDLNVETRKGSIRFDNQTFKGRLVDLPCIIESLKTIDKKTFYKSGDICQMFLCKETNGDDEVESSSSSDEKEEEKQKDATGNNIEEVKKKYQWPHGISAPLKNVRKKRFRKVAKKKIVDFTEIEKEVKRLFRKDRDALKVDYEVLVVDEPQQQTSETDLVSIKNKDIKKEMKKLAKLNSNNSFANDDSTMNHTDLNSPATQADSSNDAHTLKRNKIDSSDYLVEQVIGDVSSSSDSDTQLDQIFDNNNDRSVFNRISNITSDSFNDTTNNQNSFELMDIGDESTNLDAPHSDNNQDYSVNNEDSNTQIFDQNTQNEIIGNLSTSSDENSLSRSSSHLSDTTLNTTKKININEINMKLEKLEEELEKIKRNRKNQEDEINAINNPVLKGRLLTVLNDMIEDEKNKLSQIEELKMSLNE